MVNVPSVGLYWNVHITSGNCHHVNRVAWVPFKQAILFILFKKLWELWSFSKKKHNTALTLPVKSWNCLFRHVLFSLSSNVNWWPQKTLWTKVNRQPHERGSHLWSGLAPLTWSHHITTLVEKMFEPVWRSWLTVLDFRLLVFGQMLVNNLQFVIFFAIWGSFRFSHVYFNMADDCFQAYATAKHLTILIGRPLNLIGWD